ncbi:MAG: hypothetical protein RR691_07995, partial [Eubacterium sp.]
SLALNYLRALLLIDNENRKGFTDFIKSHEKELSFYDKYRKTALALLIGLIIGLALTYFPVKMLQEETMKAYEAELNAEQAYSKLEQSMKEIDNN